MTTVYTLTSEIPKDWHVVQLKELISDIKNGFASGKRDENGIVQVRMNNVTTNGRLLLDSYLKVPVPERVNEWILKENDFLFNNTNSIDLVGKSAIFKGAPFSCTFSNHFTRIRFKENLVLPEWIHYHFLKYWETGYFRSVAIRHVGQAAVHTDYLLKLRIPIPPLPEQRKIVGVVSTVDVAIHRVDEAIAKTERLKKGLMQKLLTKGIGHKEFKDSKIGRIPKEWEVIRLGEIIAYDKGKKPARLFNEMKPGTYPYLTAETLRTGVITKWAKETNEVIKVNKDDLILIWDGYYCGDIFVGFEGMLSSTMVKIEPKDSNINRNFLFYVLKTRFKELNTKISGMYLKHVNKQVFESLKLPFPPFLEQQKIAEILSSVDDKLELNRKRKEKLEHIKKGLMNDLLTGRKRVKVAG